MDYKEVYLEVVDLEGVEPKVVDPEVSDLAVVGLEVIDCVVVELAVAAVEVVDSVAIESEIVHWWGDVTGAETVFINSLIFMEIQRVG